MGDKLRGSKSCADMLRREAGSMGNQGRVTILRRTSHDPSVIDPCVSFNMSVATGLATLSEAIESARTVHSLRICFLRFLSGAAERRSGARLPRVGSV